MYVEPRAYTIPGEGLPLPLPLPMAGCAPCAAAMRGIGATFEDGTEKPTWWNYVPIAGVAIIATLGVLVWKLGK